MTSAQLHQALRSGSISADFDNGNLDPLSALVHHNLLQSSMLRVAGSKFAHANGLNHTDFSVLGQAIASAAPGRPATPGQLAEELALSASTLTSILERLADRGLVTRDRDPADRRRIAVVPTEEAWQLVENYYDLVHRAYEAVFSRTDDEVLTEMNHFATQLQDANSAAMAQLDSLLEKSKGKRRG